MAQSEEKQDAWKAVANWIMYALFGLSMYLVGDTISNIRADLRLLVQIYPGLVTRMEITERVREDHETRLRSLENSERRTRQP